MRVWVQQCKQCGNLCRTLINLVIAFEAHNAQEITWLDCVDYALSWWPFLATHSRLQGLFAAANELCIIHELRTESKRLFQSILMKRNADAAAAADHLSVAMSSFRLPTSKPRVGNAIFGQANVAKSRCQTTKPYCKYG